MIILPFLAKAQEEAADTVATLAAQELHEVVVAASPVVHKADMDVYRPSASAVANAKDGVQLLNNLMIPEIVVNDAMQTITTYGEAVQLRINGRMVGIEQVKSLLPESIKKVEWINNPGLRYGKVAGVLNFIVTNPTVGGSLMLSAHLKLFIIHRLDRDTSGLMMFAKNIEAKEAMQHNWNNMVLSRTYVAVVEGKVEEESGTVRSYLAETSQYEVYSTQNPEEGQLAITRYKRLDCRHGYSLMELSLDTGRKNQIRVHMKDLGHPIVGDRKYGAKSSPLRRMALHARTLRFVHPVTRKDMLFETPIPSRFLSLLK